MKSMTIGIILLISILIAVWLYFTLSSYALLEVRDGEWVLAARGWSIIKYCWPLITGAVLVTFCVVSLITYSVLVAKINRLRDEYEEKERSLTSAYESKLNWFKRDFISKFEAKAKEIHDKDVKLTRHNTALMTQLKDANCRAEAAEQEAKRRKNKQERASFALGKLKAKMKKREKVCACTNNL